MSKRVYIKPLDVVLAFVNNFPHFWARINYISPDQKPGWYIVNFTQLGMPVVDGQWLLDENHLAGEEFTMGEGLFKIRLQLLPIIEEKNSSGEVKVKTAGDGKKVEKNNGVITASFNRNGVSEGDIEIKEKYVDNVINVEFGKKKIKNSEYIEPEIA